MKKAEVFIAEYPPLILSVKEDNIFLNETKSSFLFEGRHELTCPHCQKQIGFVNFLIINGKNDLCPKCLSQFTYKFLLK